MSEAQRDAGVRQQVAALLRGGQAHTTFRRVVDDLPFELQGRTPAGLPYSAWQLLEHLRIAQRDILDFSRNTYTPLQWPGDYWPADPAPPAAGAWNASVAQIGADRAAFEALLAEGDLLAPFPWGDGQNLLRQALLIADHESYHLGELVAVRRLLGAWQPQAGHA